MGVDAAAAKAPLKKPKPGDARLASKPSKDLPSCSPAASRLLFDLSPAELVDLTAQALQHVADVNTVRLHGHKQQGPEITRFHTRDPPAISIRAYLARLLQLGPFPLDALLLAAVYINRLTHRHLAQSAGTRDFRTLFPQCPPPIVCDGQERPASTSSYTAGPLPPLTPWTIHRLMLGSLAVAAKYTSDAYIGQKRLAKVGGIAIKELLELELEVFRQLSWSCYISAAELESVCSALWHSSDKGKQSRSPESQAKSVPEDTACLQFNRLSLSPQNSQSQSLSPTPAMSDAGSESSGFASSLDDGGSGSVRKLDFGHPNNQKTSSTPPALIPMQLPSL